LPTILKKLIEIQPAYDRRDEGYGIGSVIFRAILKGPQGAVTFVLFTNWNLPHVQRELDAKDVHFDPIPVSVGCHSRTPLRESDEPSRENCEYLDGDPCYYEEYPFGTADKIYQYLLTEGDAGMWKQLTAIYIKEFGLDVQYVILYP
jgi:hypothetical protein